MNEIIPKPIVKEKSMHRRWKDGEIRFIDYIKYLESQKNIKKEKTIHQRYLDKEISGKEYYEYCKQGRDTSKEKTMYQKFKDKEIASKEYLEYITLQTKDKPDKTMYQKCRDGDITTKEYRNYLSIQNGFKDVDEYDDYKAQIRGFKNYDNYRNWLSQSKGFKDYADYKTQLNHKNGRTKPYFENKECSSYLGIHIGERYLSKIFENVTRMPNCNKGYDFICGKGYRIDVKVACLNNKGFWRFAINKNPIADYFLLLMFNSRFDLKNPTHVFLIKGTELVGIRKKIQLNKKGTLTIYNNQRNMDFYGKFEKVDKLEKLKECCNTLKNKES